MRTLVSRPGFTVGTWACRDVHRGWSDAEYSDAHRLVLVRAGRFRRHTAAGPLDADPTWGYLTAPGEEQRFAHPSGGDVCTSIRVDPVLWRSLAGEPTRSSRPAVYVDARLELLHRRFLAGTAGGDVDYALAERLLELLVSAVRQVVAGPTPATDRARLADRRLVGEARAAILADHPAARGLFPLAELLAVSPYRLSRAVTRELGVSLTRYRNRVRVGRALERLEQGDPALAELAVELGFADQAHLSRTVREHAGYSPTVLRRLLRGGPG